MQSKGQVTHEGLEIHVEPMRMAENQWVPVVRVIEQRLYATVERTLPISRKRVFATEHEAIAFGLGWARTYIDAGLAGKKGKEVVAGESQGHVIQSVTAHHP